MPPSSTCPPPASSPLAAPLLLNLLPLSPSKYSFLTSTMIKTLTPFSKTAEIMSRYRPIAPKPEPPAGGEDEPVMSTKISQSPFLRNIWPLLQARPTRTRKRGRSSTLAQAAFKRQRLQQPHLLGLSPPPAKAFSLHGFVSHHHPQVQSQTQMHAAAKSARIVTLPLLPLQPAAEYPNPPADEGLIDLNTVATPHVVPEEKDFLQQLQRPPTPTGVISPQAVRPVGSTIRVERINSITTEEITPAVTKTKSEVEAEAEAEALPVVISDSNHKVRMANSAYKEMVGQPECSWLDGKRIGGEVMLQMCDSVPVSGIGFSCWVKIEWGSEGKKGSVNAFCDVVRVACESKDYELAWRIRTQTRDASSPSSSAV